MNPQLESKYGDFWGHVEASIVEAEEECSEMVLAGKLPEFKKSWSHPQDGKIGRLSRHSWFADAKPEARKIGARAIHSAVQNMVDYYEWAEKLLSSPRSVPLKGTSNSS